MRKREDPAAPGNQDRRNLWVPLALPALSPPRALPSFSSGSGAFPAQPAGAQPNGQDSAHSPRAAAFPAPVVLAGTEGQSDLSILLVRRAAPRSVPAGPHPSGSSSGPGVEGSRAVTRLRYQGQELGGGRHTPAHLGYGLCSVSDRYVRIKLQ